MNHFKKKLLNEINNYTRCFCFKISIVYLMDTVCSIYSIEYVWVFSCSKDICILSLYDAKNKWSYPSLQIQVDQYLPLISILLNTCYMYDGPLKRF